MNAKIALSNNKYYFCIHIFSWWKCGNIDFLLNTQTRNMNTKIALNDTVHYFCIHILRLCGNIDFLSNTHIVKLAIFKPRTGRKLPYMALESHALPENLHWRNITNKTKSNRNVSKKDNDYPTGMAHTRAIFLTLAQKILNYVWVSHLLLENNTIKSLSTEGWQHSC